MKLLQKFETTFFETQCTSLKLDYRLHFLETQLPVKLCLLIGTISWAWSGLL